MLPKTISREESHSAVAGVRFVSSSSLALNVETMLLLFAPIVQIDSDRYFPLTSYPLKMMCCERSRYERNLKEQTIAQPLP